MKMMMIALMVGGVAANVRSLMLGQANMESCMRLANMNEGESATFNPMCLENGGLGCVAMEGSGAMNGCQYCGFGDYSQISCGGADGASGPSWGSGGLHRMRSGMLGAEFGGAEVDSVNFVPVAVEEPFIENVVTTRPVTVQQTYQERVMRTKPVTVQEPYDETVMEPYVEHVQRMRPITEQVPYTEPITKHRPRTIQEPYTETIQVPYEEMITKTRPVTIQVPYQEAITRHRAEVITKHRAKTIQEPYVEHITKHRAVTRQEPYTEPVTKHRARTITKTRPITKQVPYVDHVTRSRPVTTQVPVIEQVAGVKTVQKLRPVATITRSRPVTIQEKYQETVVGPLIDAPMGQRLSRTRITGRTFQPRLNRAALLRLQRAKSMGSFGLSGLNRGKMIGGQQWGV